MSRWLTYTLVALAAWSVWGIGVAKASAHGRSTWGVLAGGEENWQKVGYGVKASQRERFDVLLSCIRRSRHKPFGGEQWPYDILDVGCGLGDLHTYLDGLGWRPRSYVGIDTNGQTVKAAREQAAMSPGKLEFFEGDVLEFTLDELSLRGPFEVVCSIAAYAFKPPEQEMATSLDWVQNRIERMVQLAKDDGLVFVTLFSPWAAQLRPLGESLYVDPMVMWSWAKQVYGRVDLFHSYAPHDYALAIWKGEGEWWRQWRERSQ